MAAKFQHFLLVMMILWNTVHSTNVKSNTTMNVLFLIADDMRTDLGCYEDRAVPFMHTPNLDFLASKSLLLKKAYVQEAVCSAQQNFVSDWKKT